MEYDGKSVTFDRNVVLGIGATATVFSGTWGNQNVAIKRGELPKFNVREESTMKAIGIHQNVIDCFGILQDNDFIYIILELCDATVEQYCRVIYKKIVPPDYQALYQMADGLHFIHSKNLAHRDVSTSNVLIKLTGDNKVVLKIADFGVCKIASKSGSLSMSGDGFKGTIPFIAPELLKQMLDENYQESNESGVRLRGHISNDIFSLGCVFYRFFTKDGHPFLEGAVKSFYLTSNKIKSNIFDNKQFLERLSEEQAFAKALIVKMIDPEKEERPQLEAVKKELYSHLSSIDLQSNCTPSVPYLVEGV